MIVKWCLWCFDKHKPEVIKDINVLTGRRKIHYKCKKCAKLWVIGSDGEPQKLEGIE